MTLFAVVGTLFFIVTFLTTRERITPEASQSSSVIQDLKDLVHNRPWVVILVVTILIFITLALRGGSTIYYFQNYLQEEQLSAFLQQVGFIGFIDGLNSVLVSIGLTKFTWPEEAAASAFSLFNAGGIIFMIVGIFFSKPLADRFGKRDVFAYALLVSTVFILVFYWLPSNAIGLVFGSQILHGLFYGITIPLLWAMIADVADYSEWKNNRRATAIIFSAMIFGLKTGLSIGGSLVAAILSTYHYDAELAVQGTETVQGIKLAVSLFSATPFLISVAACLFVYEINKATEVQIESDLAARRA